MEGLPQGLRVVLLVHDNVHYPLTDHLPDRVATRVARETRVWTFVDGVAEGDRGGHERRTSLPVRGGSGEGGKDVGVAVEGRGRLGESRVPVGVRVLEMG